MDSFFYAIKPVFFWLFLLGVLVTLLINASRVFIKDTAVEKKRNYWFYCSFFATTVLLFIVGIYGVCMPDHEIWKMVVEISGGIAVILGFFVYNFHQELTPKKAMKRKTR